MTTPQERWDRKYEVSPGSTEPSAVLDEIADVFPPRGTVVDVAGGSGRNAIWFAERGYDVTIVDASPVGLAHAAAAARAGGVEIECLHRDLDAEGLPPGRTWDIVLMHLFFDRTLLAGLPAALRPAGVMAVVQPTVTNLERHEKPPERFLVGAGEIERLAAQLEGVDVVRADEAWRSSGRHEAWLIARRR